MQNGEKRFDKKKTQLTQHEYFIFHVLNLCPPNDIMLGAVCDYQHLLMKIMVSPIPNKNPIVNLNIEFSLLLQLTRLLHLSISGIVAMQITVGIGVRRI